MHTTTKQEKDEGAQAWHVFMTSQRTKEGGTRIYRRGIPGIMREIQLGITSTTVLQMNSGKGISCRLTRFVEIVDPAREICISFHQNV